MSLLEILVLCLLGSDLGPSLVYSQSSRWRGPSFRPGRQAFAHRRPNPVGRPAGVARPWNNHTDPRLDVNLYSRESSTSDITDNFSEFSSGGIKFLKNNALMSLRETPEKRRIVETDASYDFIVVGAGTAGAAIAARLSEIREVSVLLIEAGGDENVIMDIPVLTTFLQFSDDINWKYKTEPSDSYCLGMRDRRCSWPRGRVMGGSSVLNYMVATRGNRRDYDRWAQMGNFGWSWDEVLPYFKKLETMAADELRNDTRYHNFDGPVNTVYVPFRSPLGKAFMEAGIELGWEHVDYNGAKQTGFSFLQTTTKAGMRMSSNRAYLNPIKKRRNLHVTKRSLVTRILIDANEKRATGVEFVRGNRTFRVYARKEVILSAGSIGSPQLLMLSGIGPAGHLRQMGIKPVVDAPVGENLMDHIAYGGLVFLIDQQLGLRIADMVNPFNPYLRDFLVGHRGPMTVPGGSEALGFVNVDDRQDPEDYPNIELFFMSSSIGTFPSFRENLGLDEKFWRKSYADIVAHSSWSIYPILMRPKSRGKILLRDSDMRTKPRLIPNYMSDPEDVRLLVKGVRLAIEIAGTRAMRQFGSRLHPTPISGCRGFVNDSDEYWECAVRSFTMSIYHYSGTCKMGPEGDPTAVVNPRLQVIGIRGLRVADGSVMPDIPTGHPNIPIFMIAEKLADMVKQDWGYPTG